MLKKISLFLGVFMFLCTVSSIAITVDDLPGSVWDFNLGTGEVIITRNMCTDPQQAAIELLIGIVPFKAAIRSLWSNSSLSRVELVMEGVEVKTAAHMCHRGFRGKPGERDCILKLTTVVYPKMNNMILSFLRYLRDKSVQDIPELKRFRDVFLYSMIYPMIHPEAAGTPLTQRIYNFGDKYIRDWVYKWSNNLIK